MKNIIILACLIVLTACYVKVDESNVSSLSDQDICLAYTATAVKGWPLARAEILKRQLLTQEDLQNVDARIIRVGMPECGLLAMVGLPRPPSWCGRINTSGGSYGITKQYVYRSCGSYSSTKYVYVKNGVVESWQNW